MATWSDDRIELAVLLALGVASPFLLYAVHVGLERYCYIPYARRFCARRSLRPVSWACGPAFRNGMKTEYSIVGLRCLDADGGERRVELLVWILGVKEVLAVDPPMAGEGLRPTVPAPNRPERRTPLEAGLPCEIPYDPPRRYVWITAAAAVALGLVVGAFRPLLGVLVSAPILACAVLFALRRQRWSRRLRFLEGSMIVHVGCMRARPREVAYDEIGFVWISPIGPGLLCFETPRGSLDLNAAFFPDADSFITLTQSLLSIARAADGVDDAPPLAGSSPNPSRV